MGEKSLRMGNRIQEDIMEEIIYLKGHYLLLNWWKKRNKMAKRKTKDHCIIRNGNFFCLNCGAEHKIESPLEIRMLAAVGNMFAEGHKNCPKIWKQPVVDRRLTEKQKADWWLTHGERGVSSETIFQTIDGRIILKYEKGHPLDPDDFRRCYLLLETIPEWKEKLHLMKTVSPVWEALVDNWDKLTSLLEEQLQTNKSNGLYELMKSLGA